MALVGTWEMDGEGIEIGRGERAAWPKVNKAVIKSSRCLYLCGSRLITVIILRPIINIR